MILSARLPAMFGGRPSESVVVRKPARNQVRSLVLAALCAGLITSVVLLATWTAQEVGHHREELERIAHSAATRIDHEIRHAGDLLKAVSYVPDIATLDGSVCEAIFHSFLDSDPTYTAVWRLDPTGRVTCSSLPMDREIHVPRTPRYEQAFADGEPWLQPRVVGRQTGRVTIGHAQAFGIDTATPYMLAITIDAALLARELADYLPDYHAVLMVTTASGNVVMQTGPLPTSTDIDGGLHLRGEAVVGPFRIVAVTPTWVAIGDLVYHWGAQAGVLLIMALAMSAVLITWARRSISDPIDRLVVGVERIARGEADNLVDQSVKGLPEVERVALSVRQMVATLKDREASLRQSYTNMARAERIGRMGSWRWDPERDSFELSESALAILELPHGKPIDRQVLAGIVDPMDRRQWNTAFEQATVTHQIISAECRFRVGAKASRSILCYGEGHPTFDEDGRLSCYQGFVQDITAWKKTQTVLQDTIEELRQAQTARSQLLAMASHEIRTPLNGIIGYTDMLIGGYAGPLSDRQREYIGAIDVSARQLNRLIGNMLDLSAIEAGADNLLAYEPVELTGVAADAIALIRPLAESRGVTVTTQAPQAVTVSGDRLRIGQVLSNLLSNAINYNTLNGSVQVGIRQEGDQAIIAVSDTGIGIPPDRLPDLLKPFTRTRDSLVASPEGFGLGLSVVRSIVDAHGGVFELSSQPGQGTTAIVRLPQTRNIG